MRTKGTIKKYDGYCGIVETSDRKNCIFLAEDLIDKDLKVGVEVEFEIEKFITVENTELIARFIKKIK